MRLRLFLARSAVVDFSDRCLQRVGARFFHRLRMRDSCSRRGGLFHCRSGTSVRSPSSMRSLSPRATWPWPPQVGHYFRSGHLRRCRRDSPPRRSPVGRSDLWADAASLRFWRKRDSRVRHGDHSLHRADISPSCSTSAWPRSSSPSIAYGQTSPWYLDEPSHSGHST